MKQQSMQGMFNELVENEITGGLDIELLKELDRVMKRRNIYIWCNKLLIPQLLKYYDDGKTKFDIICWHKPDPMPLCGGKYLTDTEYCLYFRDGVKLNTSFDTAKTYYVMNKNVGDKKLFDHPTIKPLKIIENFIINSSNKDEVVLDCFMGSGTTAVASKETERNFIGFEINQRWCDIANDRLNGIDSSGQMCLFLK